MAFVLRTARYACVGESQAGISESANDDPYRIIFLKLNLLEHNHVFTRYQMVYIETIFASLNL